MFSSNHETTKGPNGTEVNHTIEETLLAVTEIQSSGKEKVAVKVDAFLLSQCGITAGAKVAVLRHGNENCIVLRPVEHSSPKFDPALTEACDTEQGVNYAETASA